MPWYMIRLEGEGLNEEIVNYQEVAWGLFTVKRPITIAGFYATRYVEAEDGDTAISMVCSSIKNDIAEALPAGRRCWEHLVLKVDWIETLEFKNVNVDAKGFTFF